MNKEHNKNTITNKFSITEKQKGLLSQHLFGPFSCILIEPDIALSVEFICTPLFKYETQ